MVEKPREKPREELGAAARLPRGEEAAVNAGPRGAEARAPGPSSRSRLRMISFGSNATIAPSGECGHVKIFLIVKRSRHTSSEPLHRARVVVVALAAKNVHSTFDSPERLSTAPLPSAFPHRRRYAPDTCVDKSKPDARWKVRETQYTYRMERMDLYAHARMGEKKKKT